MIKIIIVDDQSLMRDGLNIMLSTDDEFEVVASCKSGEEGVELTNKYNPDIVLMDVRMIGIGGVEATRIIKENNPSVKVIILTTFEDEEYILKALSYGASGYVFKDIESERLIEVIKECHIGNFLIEGKVAKVLATSAVKGITKDKNDDKLDFLSDREREIAKLIGDGFTNKQIAKALFITDGTVKNYVSSIYAKTGISDRTKLSIFVNSK